MHLEAQDAVDVSAMQRSRVLAGGGLTILISVSQKA